MIKKDVCLILDTETVGGFDKPVIHDLGYQIVDKDFSVLVAHRFLIKEMHTDGYALLKTSDFYASKEALYIEAKRNNTVEIVSFNEAINTMLKDVVTYKVTCVCAYNLQFDDRALKNTYSMFNEGNNERFVKRFDKLAKLCIYNLACETILNTDEYRAFAKEHNLISEKGNICTGAEECFKYLFNDEYIEEHTALRDVEDETMILEYIIKNVKGRVNYGLFYNCWRKVQ